MMTSQSPIQKEPWNGLQIQNPILCWSIIVVDVIVIYSLIEGVFGEYDRHFSFHQYQGYRDGLYQYVFPSLLVQFLLLEVLFDFRDDQHLSVSYLALMLVDALSILSIFVCVVFNMDFGYYHSIAEYLTVQLTSRAVPFLLTQSILFEIVLITVQCIKAYFPEVWDKINGYSARNEDHVISESYTPMKSSVPSVSSEHTRIHCKTSDLHMKSLNETSCTEDINNISQTNMLTDNLISADNSVVNEIQSQIQIVEELPSNAQLSSIVQSSSNDNSLLSSTDKVLESLYLPSSSLSKDKILMKKIVEKVKPAAKSNALATRVLRILISPKKYCAERSRPPLPRKKSFRIFSSPKLFATISSTSKNNKQLSPEMSEANGTYHVDFIENSDNSIIYDKKQTYEIVSDSNDNIGNGATNNFSTMVMGSVDDTFTGPIAGSNPSLYREIETQTDINSSHQIFIRDPDFTTKDVFSETTDLSTALSQEFNGSVCDAEVQTTVDDQQSFCDVEVQTQTTVGQQSVSVETNTPQGLSVATQINFIETKNHQSTDTLGLGELGSHVETDTHDLISTHEVGSDSCAVEILYSIRRDVETETNLQEICSFQDQECDTSDLHPFTTTAETFVTQEEVKLCDEKEIQCLTHEIMQYLDQEVQTIDVRSFDEIGVQCEQSLRDANTSPVNQLSSPYISPKEEEEETDKAAKSNEKKHLTLTEPEKGDNLKNNKVICSIKQQLFNSPRSFSSSSSSSSNGSGAKEVVRKGLVSDLVQTFDKSKSPFSSTSKSKSNSSEKNHNYAVDNELNVSSSPLSPSVSSTDMNNLHIYDSLIISPSVLENSDQPTITEHLAQDLPNINYSRHECVSSAGHTHSDSELLQVSGGEVSSQHSDMGKDDAPRFATLHLVTLASTTPVKQSSFSFLADDSSNEPLDTFSPSRSRVAASPKTPLAIVDGRDNLPISDVPSSLSKSFKKKKSFFDTALATPAETDLESDNNYTAPKLLFDGDKEGEDAFLMDDLFTTAIEGNSNNIPGSLSSPDIDIGDNADDKAFRDNHSISTIEAAREDEEADDEQEAVLPTGAVATAFDAENNETHLADGLDAVSVRTQSTAKRSIRSSRSSTSESTRHTFHSKSSRNSRQSHFSSRSSSSRSSFKTAVWDTEEAEDEAQIRRTIQSLDEHHQRLRQRIMLNQQERQMQLMKKKSSYPLLPLSEPVISRNIDDTSAMNDSDSDDVSFLSMSSSYFSTVDNKFPSDEFAEDEDSEEDILQTSKTPDTAVSVTNGIETFPTVKIEKDNVRVMTNTPPTATTGSQSSSPGTETDRSKDAHSASTSSSLEWLLLQVAALQPKMSPVKKGNTSANDIDDKDDASDSVSPKNSPVIVKKANVEEKQDVDSPETCDLAVTLPLSDTPPPSLNTGDNIEQQRQREHLLVRDTSRLLILDLDTVFLHLTMSRDYELDSDEDNDTVSFSANASATPLLSRLSERLQHEWRVSLQRNGRFPLLCLRLHDKQGLRKLRYVHCVSQDTHDDNCVVELKLQLSSVPQVFLHPSYVSCLLRVASPINETAETQQQTRVAQFLSAVSQRTVRLITHLLDAEFPVSQDSLSLIRHMRDTHLSETPQTRHQALCFLFVTQRSAYHAQSVLRAAETVDGAEQHALETAVSQVKEVSRELPQVRGVVLFTLQEKWPFTNKFGHLFSSAEHHLAHTDTLFLQQSHSLSNNSHHRGSAYVAHRQWQRFQQLHRRKLAFKFVAIDSGNVILNPL